MGRSWKYVAAWMVATATATTVSWLGVRVGLAPTLTAEAPVAIDVDRRYTEVQLGLTESAPAPPPTAPRRPAAAKSPATAPSSAPARAKPRTTPGPSKSATPTPAARSAATDRRPRYRLRAEGGVVTVAYSSTRVDVVDAAPIQGYTASVDRRSDRLLAVRLTGPRHTSAITAYWIGRPGAQIVEEYTR